MLYSIIVSFSGFLRNFFNRSINTLAGKVSDLFNRPKKSAAPLADRLLADALRLGEIPSPSKREEERAVFILERLDSLALAHTADGAGNILVLLRGREHTDGPLLLFTKIGSRRWTPLECLGKLDPQYARGAGLAEVLGPAALLSLAEGYVSGRLSWPQDVLLLFSVSSFEDPSSDTFLSVTSGLRDKPFAALGIRGLSLGALVEASLGRYRIETSLQAGESQKGAKPGPAGPKENLVVKSMLDMAGAFMETAGTMGLDLFIRKIEAASAYERTPQEGILELDIESKDKAELDGGLEKIRHSFGEIVHRSSPAGTGLSGTLKVVSHIPPGNVAVNENLNKILRKSMKDLKIKCEEETGSDPASFLSEQGIPSMSIGIARGRGGLKRDTIEIASIEKGRQLLEKLVTELTAPPFRRGAHGR